MNDVDILYVRLMTTNYTRLRDVATDL